MERRVIVRKHREYYDEITACLGCPAFSGTVWGDNDGEHGSGFCHCLYAKHVDYSIDVPWEIPERCPMARPDHGMLHGSWRSNLGRICAIASG